MSKRKTYIEIILVVSGVKIFFFFRCFFFLHANLMRGIPNSIITNPKILASGVELPPQAGTKVFKWVDGNLEDCGSHDTLI